ncbi:Rieske (2Fe-2S) protein [Streptacidiphilus sp. ASG 303]|nr:Rieske (2Fe-2S) protein [Streptacidiphilus sp. ASG 303]
MEPDQVKQSDRVETTARRARQGARRAGAAGAVPEALDALGRIEALDGVVAAVQRAVRGLPLGPLRDVLHGRQVGHPLHPALVQLPMGAWMSASVLDLVPGASRGARVLVGAGVVAAAPAALAGWVDWAEQHEQQMRTGLVHAASNVLAVGLYAGSWAARGRGREGLGKALALAGLSAAGAGGFIGGHLAYRQGAGANKAEPVPHLVEPGWHTVGRMEEFPAGAPVRRAVGEVPVLVVREAGGEVHVLADRCSHLSGPLSEGEVADGCVTCPWHGSVFRLADGRNVRGPATAPQPSFEARVRDDGTVEVRLPDAG